MPPSPVDEHGEHPELARRDHVELRIVAHEDGLVGSHSRALERELVDPRVRLLDAFDPGDHANPEHLTYPELGEQVLEPRLEVRHEPEDDAVARQELERGTNVIE